MTRLSMICVSVLAMTMCGCGSAPPGASFGRISVSDTTRAERASGQMLTADLGEASSMVAESLIAEVNRLAEEDWGDYRVTLILGDVVNNTQGRLSTTDFEYVRERMMTQLTKSRAFRDNVKFVRSRARLESLNRRELQRGGGDLLQEGQSGDRVTRPDAEYVYYLNGDMYGVFRGSTSTYYLKFTIDRASDGEIVFSEAYEVKYR